MADADRPDPAAATTPVEFVEAMRRLKRWTGMGYRQLEKRAVAGGQALPRSTLTVALTRNTLPREDLVMAFAYACGCDENQTAQWVAARRSIAAGGVLAAPAIVRPQNGRRIKVRTAIVVLALAIVTALVAYLVRPNRDAPQHSPDQAAPASPGSSQAEPTPSRPESSVAIAPVTASATTPQPTSAPSQATKATTTTPPVPPPQQIRFPAPTVRPTPPPSSAPPSQVPGDPGRDTIQLPGEPTIYCPTPYLGTSYGPLAQCTQQSGDQVRHGFYSPYTREFGPSDDWIQVVDKKWYDGSVLATDGVHAWARGYGAVNTMYGAGVWATQYRDGEARWGLINLVTNRFYPSAGWQPAGR